MFCARCGQQIPDASEICPLCGREATIPIEPQPGVGRTDPGADLAQSQPAMPQISPRTLGLQGVGGWLFFFCITLIVLSPLATFVEVMALPNIDAPGMILELIRAAFGIVVGIFLWNLRPVAFTLLWIYFAFCCTAWDPRNPGFCRRRTKAPRRPDCVCARLNLRGPMGRLFSQVGAGQGQLWTQSVVGF